MYYTNYESPRLKRVEAIEKRAAFWKRVAIISLISTAILATLAYANHVEAHRIAYAAEHGCKWVETYEAGYICR